MKRTRPQAIQAQLPPHETNEQMLEALMHATHTPEELAQFHAEMDSHHAAHRDRMTQRAPIEHKDAGSDDETGAHKDTDVDVRKLAHGLELIAQALKGFTQ